MRKLDQNESMNFCKKVKKRLGTQGREQQKAKIYKKYQLTEMQESDPPQHLEKVHFSENFEKKQPKFKKNLNDSCLKGPKPDLFRKSVKIKNTQIDQSTQFGTEHYLASYASHNARFTCKKLDFNSKSILQSKKERKARQRHTVNLYKRRTRTFETVLMLQKTNLKEIDDQKIIEQENLLQSHHLRKSLRKTCQPNSKQHAFPNQEKMRECLKRIDMIYENIHEISSLGYRKKINNWIVNYCVNNRFWMIEVFLAQTKIQHFEEGEKREYIKEPTEVKNRLVRYIYSPLSKGIDAVLEDVNGFHEFIQNVLTHKKQVELIKIQKFIEQKIKEEEQQKQFNEDYVSKHSNLGLRFVSNKNEKFNFMDQLKRVEDKFGPMKYVTSTSKKRFEDLNQTYNRLQKIL